MCIFIIIQLSQRKVVSKSESSEDQQALAVRNQVARMLVANALWFSCFICRLVNITHNLSKDSQDNFRPLLSTLM